MEVGVVCLFLSTGNRKDRESRRCRGMVRAGGQAGKRGRQRRGKTGWQRHVDIESTSEPGGKWRNEKEKGSRCVGAGGRWRRRE